MDNIIYFNRNNFKYLFLRLVFKKLSFSKLEFFIKDVFLDRDNFKLFLV